MIFYFVAREQAAKIRHIPIPVGFGAELPDPLRPAHKKLQLSSTKK